MAQVFVNASPKLAFAGDALFASDPPTGTGTTYAFPDERVLFSKSEYNGYIPVIDNTGVSHVAVPGYKIGALTVSGIWYPDRGPDTLLTTAFGLTQRTTTIPFVMNLLPTKSNDTPVKASGIFWAGINIRGRYDTRGPGMAIRWDLIGVVIDPDNSLGAPTLSVPAGAGAAGAGPSSFMLCSFTNGQSGSLVTYDLIRAFSLTLDNQGQIIPATGSVSNRRVAGWTPGPLGGGVSFTQLRGASNSLPSSAGTYPLQMVIPAGDSSVTDTIDLSAKYDANAFQYAPLDFPDFTDNYTLHSLSAGATTSAGWSFAIAAA